MINFYGLYHLINSFRKRTDSFQNLCIAYTVVKFNFLLVLLKYLQILKTPSDPPKTSWSGIHDLKLPVILTFHNHILADFSCIPWRMDFGKFEKEEIYEDFFWLALSE